MLGTRPVLKAWALGLPPPVPCSRPSVYKPLPSWDLFSAPWDANWPGVGIPHLRKQAESGEAPSWTSSRYSWQKPLLLVCPEALEGPRCGTRSQQGSSPRPGNSWRWGKLAGWVWSSFPSLWPVSGGFVWLIKSAEWFILALTLPVVSRKATFL